MKQQLEEIKSRAAAALANAKLPQEIDELRVRFLGKKGELTGILKQMGKLSPEERPVIGQLANEVRSWIERSSDDVPSLQGSRQDPCRTRLCSRST